MKGVIIAFMILLALPIMTNAQKGIEEDLRTELLEMGRIDQEVRDRFMKLLQTKPDLNEPSDEFLALVAEQNKIDETNFRRLEEIIKEYGWPGKDLVGEEASGFAWLILQHAKLEQQKPYLPIIKNAVSEGQAKAYNLAMLEDRILAGEGQKQIYGTQIVNGPDGKMVVHPIEDPVNLDERRKSVGLMPMEEYLKQSEINLGQSIDRGNLDSK